MSNTEVEYIAATKACKEAIWLAGLVKEMGITIQMPTLHCDSLSAIMLAKNPIFHAKTKHIEVKYYFKRDMLEDKLMRLVKVHTDDNSAYLLTKGTHQDLFGVFLGPLICPKPNDNDQGRVQWENAMWLKMLGSPSPRVQGSKLNNRLSFKKNRLKNARILNKIRISPLFYSCQLSTWSDQPPQKVDFGQKCPHNHCPSFKATSPSLYSLSFSPDLEILVFTLSLTLTASFLNLLSLFSFLLSSQGRI